MLKKSYFGIIVMKVFIALFALFFFVSAGYGPPKEKRLRKVVIDAGHGGRDPGTLGKKIYEKEVTLSVALKLGKYINENFKDVEVIYTRSTDEFIEVYRRAKIANENHADLFISVHCNGTKSSQARGTECWVMGLNKSKENLEVAKMENAAILQENDYNQYDGFDPQSPEAVIIFSLYQNIYLDKSLELASKIQNHFNKRLNLDDRGVKQAGFWVLYKTTMPGVLIETGFLSNPEDEKFLRSVNGQNQIAYSIFLAFKEYKENFEGVSSPLLVSPPADEIVEEDTGKVAGKSEIIPENPGIKQNEKSQEKHIYKPDQKQGNANLDSKVVYKIQIASSEKLLPDNSPVFKGVGDISHYMHNGSYKFTTGKCQSMKEALTLQKKMLAKGFKDAFVVPFLNNERISLEEAKKLSSN